MGYSWLSFFLSFYIVYGLHCTTFLNRAWLIFLRKMIDIKKLEKMLDVVIEKIEHSEEKLVVYVSREKIGRAIGPSGSVVRSAELVIGKPIELRSL